VVIIVTMQDVSGLPESYAQWVARAIRRARLAGSDVVTLFDSSVPEPRELIAEVVAQGFASGITSRYVTTFGGGNRFVLDALATRYAVPREQLLCTTGATGAVATVLHTLIAPGDEVLVETPGFDLFTALAEDAGAIVRPIARPAPLFALDTDEIARAIGPKTRAILLSNLHNPSGMPIAHDALLRLAAIAEARGVTVVIDEVYGDYADAATRPAPACSLSPHFVSISSMTKIWGLSTLRCGWIVAARPLMDRIRDRFERLEFGLSNLSHAVAALVLEQRERFDDYTQATLREARPLMESCFDRWRADGLIEGVLPDFGCIFFPKLIGIDDTAHFSDWLAERSGVVVAPGVFFGAADHIRIGHAQRIGDLERGFVALGEGMRAYRDQRSRVRKAG